MKITETPENWLILKLRGNYYKVFSTWSGGYLDGDRWKLNSGVKEIKQDEDFYYFIGFSGSCYKCYKNAYGVATSYGRGILDRMLELSDGKIEVMEDIDDWSTILE